jgi:hypothetical protein
MKTYNLPKLDIPASWNDVNEFCDWYIEKGLPFNFPKNAEVFLSDDATASCLFRHGQFQVELYLIHPNPKVPIHEHPNVDVIKLRLFYDQNGNSIAEASSILRKGQSHGAGVRLEAEEIGFPLLAIQHWKVGQPTTVASAWKGKTVGVLQENLIRRFHPNALVVDGYADITKPSDYIERLKNGTSS